MNLVEACYCLLILYIIVKRRDFNKVFVLSCLVYICFIIVNSDKLASE